MTPEESLKMLHQVIYQMNGTHQVHFQLQQAIKCLQDFIVLHGASPEPLKEILEPNKLD